MVVVVVACVAVLHEQICNTVATTEKKTISLCPTLSGWHRPLTKNLTIEYMKIVI